MAPAENRLDGANFWNASYLNEYSVYPSSDGVTLSHFMDTGQTAGDGAMTVNKTEGSGERFIYRSVYGLYPGTYTLSMYVCTFGAVLKGKGATATVNVFNSSGYRTGNASVPVKTTSSGEWVRLEVTVNVVSGDTRMHVGLYMDSTTSGNIKVDDIQVNGILQDLPEASTFSATADFMKATKCGRKLQHVCFKRQQLSRLHKEKSLDHPRNINIRCHRQKNICKRILRVDSFVFGGWGKGLVRFDRGADEQTRQARLSYKCCVL